MQALARLARSKAAAVAAAVVLAALLAMSALGAFPRQFGIDFYQFWGVPLARDSAGIAQTPYVDPPAYARVLNAAADSSPSVKLRNANRQRRELEPMATPFLYSVFAAFPADYERAQAAFTAVQYALALFAVFVLARLRGLAAAPAACVSLLVLLTFNPFAQDVRVGNVNSLQLAAIAVLIGISARERFSGNAWVDGLFVGSLAVLVAFKPNTPWIAAALALNFAIRRGPRAFAIGVAEAAVLGAGAFAIGAAYFGGAHAWLEWLRFARGMDGSGLALTLGEGNLSIAMALAGSAPALNSVAWGLVLAGLLAALLAGALSSWGRRVDAIGAASRRAFSDPWFAASAGILLTFAMSPLAWPHYHVLLLVPIAWLSRTGARLRAGSWGAIACYLVLSRPLIDGLLAAQLYGLLQALTLASWLLLVPGLLAHAARSAAQDGAAAAR